jgi:YHS domain-containing protein
VAKVLVHCDHCGAAIERTPFKVQRAKHHFCNPACKNAWQVEGLRGANNPAWSSVEKPCAQCGKPLNVIAYRAEHYGRHFCNSTCMGKWQSVHRVGQNNYSWRGGMVDVTCGHCGQQFQDYPSNRQGHNLYFCSRRCQGAWQALARAGANSPTWKGGKIEYYGPNWRAQQRAARKRDKNTCQHCGKTARQLKQALDVHHIMPFRDFGYIPGVNDAYLLANVLTNLVCLCRGCHKRAEHNLIPLQLRLI